MPSRGTMLSQLVSKISFWVLIAGVLSVLIGNLFLSFVTALNRSNGLVYLPLILGGIARNLTILCFFALGAKIGCICLFEILQRDWGIRIGASVASSADLRIDALILGGLVAFLVVTYNPIKG